MPYSPDQAAARSGYHPETVRRLVREGKLATDSKGRITAAAVAQLKARQEARANNRAALAQAAEEAGSKRYVTRVQAAGIIGVSPRTVDRMIQRGDLAQDTQRAKDRLPSIPAKACRSMAKRRGN